MAYVDAVGPGVGGDDTASRWDGCDDGRLAGLRGSPRYGQQRRKRRCQHGEDHIAQVEWCASDEHCSLLTVRLSVRQVSSGRPGVGVRRPCRLADGNDPLACCLAFVHGQLLIDHIHPHAGHRGNRVWLAVRIVAAPGLADAVIAKASQSRTVHMETPLPRMAAASLAGRSKASSCFGVVSTPVRRMFLGIAKEHGLSCCNSRHGVLYQMSPVTSPGCVHSRVMPCATRRCWRVFEPLGQVEHACGLCLGSLAWLM